GAAASESAEGALNPWPRVSGKVAESRSPGTRLTDVGDSAKLTEMVPGGSVGPSSSPQPAPKTRTRARRGRRQVAFRTIVAGTSICSTSRDELGSHPHGAARRERGSRCLQRRAPPRYTRSCSAREGPLATVLSLSIALRTRRGPSLPGPTRNVLPYGDLTRRDRPPAQLP